MIQTPRLDLLPLAPELILVGVGLVLLVASAIARRGSWELPFLVVTLVALAGAAAVSLPLWGWEGPRTVLAGMVAADQLAVIARLLLLAIGGFAAVYGHHYFAASESRRAEFYPLLLFALSGMTLLAVSADLIVAFLALEILSLSLYVMTALSFRLVSSEAATKYFLLGAFSSAFFLYGVAMAYGAAGTTHIDGVALALSGRTGSEAIALIAMGLLFIGFGFKVSLVPFHMWTPDVYQGAPTSVTAFMAAATKVAAFIALIRVIDVAFQPLTLDWQPIVWVLAVVSMVLGSVMAVAQTDLKRLLAYSSIANAGFILTGLVAADQTGISAALFYLVAYSATILGAFGVVMLASGDSRERTSFSSFEGLARRSPLLAGLLTLFLVSLAGIPPTAGFIAKASVFGAAISAGAWPLALIGVVASVVTAYVYLRVVVLMYMREPEGADIVDRASMQRLVVGVAAALVLILGVFPGVLVSFLERAAVLRW